MQISDKNNFWKAWDYTRQELAYHANLGKTTRNCNSNSQSKSSRANTVNTSQQNTWSSLKSGWSNNTKPTQTAVHSYFSSDTQKIQQQLNKVVVGCNLTVDGYQSMYRKIPTSMYADFRQE